ncbi:MAG: hypothetical protein KJ804_08150 [Proteobacteria bacterium]|nr:hypothetical protein [Pseudomonadota bacterium]MBU1058270.1 hypothetical protein [Pseudomonadota bacterium]
MKKIILFATVLLCISFSFGHAGEEPEVTLKSLLEMLAGLRGEQVDLMPLEAISDPHPVFQWDRMAAVESYLLRVFWETEQGSEEVFQWTTRENRVQYPEHAVPLQAGELYFWMVYDSQSKAALSKGRLYFYLLNGEEQERTEKTQGNFQQLFRQYPEEPYFHALLAHYCHARGLRQQTKVQLAQALGLDPDAIPYSQLLDLITSRNKTIQQRLLLVNSAIEEAMENKEQEEEARLREEAGDLFMEQLDISKALEFYTLANKLQREERDQERIAEKISRLNNLLRIIQEKKPFVL